MVNLMLEASHIERLNSDQLSDLLRYLLHLECLENDIPTAAKWVPSKKNTADGGNDGEISWRIGDSDDEIIYWQPKSILMATKSGYLPHYNILFQCKASKLSPAACADEIGDSNGTMKTEVRRYIKNNGIYILFTKADHGPPEISRRIDAMLARAQDLEQNLNISREQFQVYCAGKICEWVNRYPQIQLQVRAWLGLEIPGYFFVDLQWIVTDEEQFVEIPAFIRFRNLLINKQGNQTIVSGSKGSGRTSWVYHAMKDRNGSIIYCDQAQASVTGLELCAQATSISKTTNSNILYIFDNVAEEDIAAFKLLKKENIRHIIITEANNTPGVINIGNHTSSDMMSIAEKYYPDRGYYDLVRLIEYAGSSLPILLIPYQRGWVEGDYTQLSSDELLMRSFLGRRVLDNDALLTLLTVIAVFGSLEHKDSNEFTFACDLAGIQPIKAHRLLKRHSDNSVAFVGKNIKITYKPLSWYLAKQWWREASDEQIKDLIMDLRLQNHALYEKFFSQMLGLKQSKRASDFCRRELEQGGLFSLFNINHICDSTNLEALVRVIPRYVFGMLEAFLDENDSLGTDIYSFPLNVLWFELQSDPMFIFPGEFERIASFMLRSSPWISGLYDLLSSNVVYPVDLERRLAFVKSYVDSVNMQSTTHALHMLLSALPTRDRKAQESILEEVFSSIDDVIGIAIDKNQNDLIESVKEALKESIRYFSAKMMLQISHIFQRYVVFADDVLFCIKIFDELGFTLRKSLGQRNPISRYPKPLISSVATLARSLRLDEKKRKLAYWLGGDPFHRYCLVMPPAFLPTLSEDARYLMDVLYVFDNVYYDEAYYSSKPSVIADNIISFKITLQDLIHALRHFSLAIHLVDETNYCLIRLGAYLDQTEENRRLLLETVSNGGLVADMCYYILFGFVCNMSETDMAEFFNHASEVGFSQQNINVIKQLFKINLSAKTTSLKAFKPNTFVLSKEVALRFLAMSICTEEEVFMSLSHEKLISVFADAIDAENYERVLTIMRFNAMASSVNRADTASMIRDFVTVVIGSQKANDMVLHLVGLVLTNNEINYYQEVSVWLLEIFSPDFVSSVPWVARLEADVVLKEIVNFLLGDGLLADIFSNKGNLALLRGIFYRYGNVKQVLWDTIKERVMPVDVGSDEWNHMLILCKLQEDKVQSCLIDELDTKELIEWMNSCSDRIKACRFLLQATELFDIPVANSWQQLGRKPIAWRGVGAVVNAIAKSDQLVANCLYDAIVNPRQSLGYSTSNDEWVSKSFYEFLAQECSVIRVRKFALERIRSVTTSIDHDRLDRGLERKYTNSSGKRKYGSRSNVIVKKGKRLDGSTSKSTISGSKVREVPSAASLSSPLDALTYQKIPGDGHCLFHAVGIYAGQDAQFLRNIVSANLEENKLEYLRDSELSEAELDQRIDDIRNSNLWGGNLELVVLQRVLNRLIIVLRTDANPTILDDIDQYEDDPIYVLYNGESHYDGLLLSDGKDGAGLLAEIRQGLSDGLDLFYKVRSSDDFPIQEPAPSGSPPVDMDLVPPTVRPPSAPSAND